MTLATPKQCEEMHRLGIEFSGRTTADQALELIAEAIANLKQDEQDQLACSGGET